MAALCFCNKGPRWFKSRARITRCRLTVSDWPMELRNGPELGNFHSSLLFAHGSVQKTPSQVQTSATTGRKVRPAALPLCSSAASLATPCNILFQVSTAPSEYVIRYIATHNCHSPSLPSVRLTRFYY
jgi:hypothetical protein